MADRRDLVTGRALRLSAGGEVYDLRVAGPDAEGRIAVTGIVHAPGGEPTPLEPFEAAVAADGRGLVLRDGSGRTWRCAVAGEAGAVWVAIRGRSVRLEREPPGRAGRPAAHHAADDEVRAPMTGVLVDVRASAGGRVARDEVVAVMEAMKMEYRLLAPRDGTVAEVKGARGDRLEVGALVLRLEPAPAEGDGAPP
jgi:biotin carboxyl carrier protein